MGKAKKLVRNIRIIIAIIAVLLALVAIHPNPWADGVAIRSVTVDSAASQAGIESPLPTSTPMSKERITSMNNIPINDVGDYYEFVDDLKPNRTVHIRTNRGLYKLTTREAFEIIGLNETNETESISASVEDIGLSVYNAPKTNIRKGLDLQGGTRVLLEPDEELPAEEMDTLLESIKYRINVYGLTDIVVRSVGDLSGNKYILIEIAGAKEAEVKELISKQGKFEATVGNQTVFKGGDDITYVCRSADCSGIDPSTGCGKTEDGAWSCANRFSISLTPEAAQSFADATMDLSEIDNEGRCKLSEQIVFYLDDSNVSSLDIVCDLKGQAATEIAITGGGAGGTREEAVINSLENMKGTQTILITGSLPVKLNIVKADEISPVFGEEFLKNSLFIGLLAILAVTCVIFVRYRRIKIAVPVFFTSIVEVTLLLGFAALIGWNLDLAAIAGIIIVVGTGVDHQIVITDGVLAGKNADEIYDWKKRIKNAFFIIFAAYLTTIFAMLPLWAAGAGLLKLFALTTIFGITFGVLITRPAYAAAIEILMKNE